MMYEVENEGKLGGGIIAVMVIQLIANGFALIGNIVLFGAADAFNEQLAIMGMTETITTPQLIVSLILSVAMIIACILILMKKKIGLMVYGAIALIGIIVNIIFSGFSIISIISSLIFPAILFALASKRMEVFN